MVLKKLLNKQNFIRINTITLGSVLVLILIGSIVRVLGAGMGCPDWPKCFGSYIPPTSSAGLPDNYQDIFRAQRISKNERLAKTLERIGYTNLSQQITNDPAVLEEQAFDVTKAWIEYINRLVGVLIGFLVILNMFFSFSFRKESISVPVVGVGIFLLTVFQGWIGSLVVSTNLLHGFITFHMLLALFMVALLLFLNVRIKKQSVYSSKPIFWVAVITFVLFIPQIILGTEVRGTVDDLLISSIDRSDWVDRLTNSFLIHRSYSWLVLVGSVALLILARKTNELWLNKTVKLLVILVVTAMFAGIGLVRFGFPVVLQPLHLIIAVGIFSILFYLILRLRISN